MRRVLAIRVMLNALGLALSMLAGAAIGCPWFIGIASSPMEAAIQPFKGMFLGSLFGAVAYKAVSSYFRPPDRP